MADLIPIIETRSSLSNDHIRFVFCGFELFIAQPDFFQCRELKCSPHPFWGNSEELPVAADAVVAEGVEKFGFDKGGVCDLASEK